MAAARIRGTAARLAGYTLVLAALAHLATGCGFFDIRSPAAPVPGVRVPRAQPVDPDSVLFNFEQAVIFKLDGLAQYDEALAETFALILDPVDVSELGLAADSLTKAQDVFAQRVFSQETADSLFFFFGDVPPQNTGGQALYEAIPYELQFLRQEADSVVLVGTVKGTADITVTEGEQIWAMTRWVDERDPGGLESWGRVHGSRAIIQ